MSVSETIQEILQGIDDAQYGRDMRQYIHKGIQKCYEEGSAGETDLVARESVEKILEIFGDVEATSTASKDYAIGDSLIYDGRLYKVTVAITEGDTLTVGTNIEETRASSNIGNMYTIPYRTYDQQSWIPEKNITVYIIPSIKLMYIDIAFTTNAHEAINSVIIADRLPKPRHTGGLLYRNVCTNLWTWGVPTTAFAYLSTANSSSATGDDNQLQINLPATSGNSYYEGQLITFYTDLNSHYPFSEATLVTS